MKKIIFTVSVLVLVLLFAGCSQPLGNSFYGRVVSVESNNIFSINGQPYRSVSVVLPVAIGNPNNHLITVVCDEVEFDIQALGSISIPDRSHLYLSSYIPTK